ncbi:uncharacterized protein LAESUDRAFT_765623, partial [Laetiporus sulphureus 93-53]
MEPAVVGEVSPQAIFTAYVTVKGRAGGSPRAIKGLLRTHAHGVPDRVEGGGDRDVREACLGWACYKPDVRWYKDVKEEGKKGRGVCSEAVDAAPLHLLVGFTGSSPLHPLLASAPASSLHAHCSRAIPSVRAHDTIDRSWFLHKRYIRRPRLAKLERKERKRSERGACAEANQGGGHARADEAEQKMELHKTLMIERAACICIGFIDCVNANCADSDSNRSADLNQPIAEPQPMDSSSFSPDITWPAIDETLINTTLTSSPFVLVEGVINIRDFGARYLAASRIVKPA